MAWLSLIHLGSLTAGKTVRLFPSFGFLVLRPVYFVVLSTVSAVRFMPGDEYFLVLRSEIRKVPGFLDLVRDGCSPKLRPIIWGYLSGTVERYLSA